jgi:hypothetical protein
MLYRVVKTFEEESYTLVNHLNFIQFKGSKKECIVMYEKNFERPYTKLEITKL